MVDTPLIENDRKWSKPRQQEKGVNQEVQHNILAQTHIRLKLLEWKIP